MILEKLSFHIRTSMKNKMLRFSNGRVNFKVCDCNNKPFDKLNLANVL